jgi:polar amino acid transport system permease protein
MDLRWEILAGYWPLFVSGVWMTLQLTLVAVSAGLVLGVGFGLIATSADAPQPPSRLARGLLGSARGVTLAYVTFFRGTPLFVQILLVHFALMPALIHPDSGWLLAGETARTFRQEHGAFFLGLPGAVAELRAPTSARSSAPASRASTAARPRPPTAWA